MTVSMAARPVGEFDIHYVYLFAAAPATRVRRPARKAGQPAATRDYRSRKRDAGAAATRTRIVAAAAPLLRSPARKPLSIEAVAQAAGVTRVTVYKQFGSRRGLLEAVFDEYARRGGLNEIQGAMRESNPRVALRRIVEIFCRFWSVHSR